MCVRKSTIGRLYMYKLCRVNLTPASIFFGVYFNSRMYVISGKSCQFQPSCAKSVQSLPNQSSRHSRDKQPHVKNVKLLTGSVSTSFNQRVFVLSCFWIIKWQNINDQESIEASPCPNNICDTAVNCRWKHYSRSLDPWLIKKKKVTELRHMHNQQNV